MREEYDRFTIQARNVLQHAQEEADRFYDDYISPEHILLGLLNEQEGVAVHVLTRLRFEPESARRLVELPMKYGERPRPPWSKQGLSPGAQLVIQLALDEARRLNHNYVGTHHLLLGVVAEGESPAADFLASHGAQVETVRAAVAIIHRIVDEPDEIFDILALGQGAAGKSEADRTERFDLGDTVKSGRSRNRGGDSLVEALDEIYDTLLINDSDVPDAPVAPKGKRGAASASGKRNGHGAGAHGPVTEGDDGIEVVSLDVEVEEAEPEEGEPDAAALARVGEVPEVEKPEELEKVIDRALNMEGISVDDPVRIYLREIGRIALLKPPDESALAAKMALGRAAKEQLRELDAQAALDGSALTGTSEYEETCRQLRALIAEGDHSKQILVQANLRLVVSIARRYIGRGLSLLDLVQEGNIGLMKAADKFDHAKGFKFSTYATWWIRQAITRAISDQSRTIRLPVHVTEMVTRLRRAAHELQQKLLREPTEEELGQELNMPAERVRKILDMARHPASLDAPMEEGEDSFLGDFIEDERTATPMEEASRQMLREQVDDILLKLPERERQILQMRYGLKDDRPRTLEEVAKAFGITRERIRQAEGRIIRKLRPARHGRTLYEETKTRSEKFWEKESKSMTSASALGMINTLFDYSMWARDRLLGVVEGLDDEALRRVPESGAYGSIHDTLAHMAVSEWMWVRRCLGDAPGRLPKGEDFANLRVLVDWWNQIHTETVAYLADLSDSDLNEEVTYTGPDGKNRTRKVWHMLLQVTNHQTEHRAQLGTILGQMGVEVPATDLVVYLSRQ